MGHEVGQGQRRPLQSALDWSRTRMVMRMRTRSVLGARAGCGARLRTHTTHDVEHMMRTFENLSTKYTKNHTAIEITVVLY